MIKLRIRLHPRDRCRELNIGLMSSSVTHLSNILIIFMKRGTSTCRKARKNAYFGKYIPYTSNSFSLKQKVTFVLFKCQRTAKSFKTLKTTFWLPLFSWHLYHHHSCSTLLLSKHIRKFPPVMGDD